MDGTLDRSALLRRLAVAGAAPAALAWAARAEAGAYPRHPTWRFAFVNHETTNPFFVATQYGAEDACSLTGCTYDWTGSARGDVHEAAAALDSAVKRKVDGIAVTLVDRAAFDGPLARARAAGIPVVAYYSDATTRRLPFVGEDPDEVGRALGDSIARLVPQGDIGVFVPSPRGHDVRVRLGALTDAMGRRRGDLRVISTPVDVAAQVARVDQTVQQRKHLRGLVGIDGGSTVGIALAARKYDLSSRGVHAGGMDVVPTTLQAIDDGHLDFTVDRQPYLQGFLPVVQLFLAKLSGGLVQPSSTNTGLVFVTKSNVSAYLAARNRFEGTSSKHQAGKAG